MWEYAVTTFADHQGQIVNTKMAESVDIEAALMSVLRSAVCVADHNERIGNDSSLTFRRNTVENGFEWGAPIVQTYDDQLASNTDGYSQDACGKVTFPSVPSQGLAALLQVGGTQANGNMALGFAGSMTAQQAQNKANQVIINAQKRAFEELALETEKLAPLIVARGDAKISPREVSAALYKASQKYQTSVIAASNSALSESGGLMKTMSDALKSDSARLGWLSAGTWYYQVARINSELTKTATFVPTVVMPEVVSGSAATISIGKAGLSPEMSKYLDALTEDSMKRIAAWRKADEIKKGGLATNMDGSTVNVGVNRQNWQSAISLAGSFSDDVSKMIGYDKNSPLDPIIQLKNSGDYMLATGATAMTLLAASDLAGPASGVAKAALGKLPVIGGILKMGQSLFTSTAIALLAMGGILSLYLPMLPFILWFGSIVGWAISLCEMVASATLWAVAHMHPEGEGASSHAAAPGFLIIAEVFVRPALMVVALLFSMSITKPLMDLLATMFFNVSASIQADSASGVLSALGIIAIYVILCVTLVTRSFSLIHVLPSTVMRWIGGHHVQGHDQSQDMASLSRGAATTALMQGGSILSGAMTTKKHVNDAAPTPGGGPSEQSQPDVGETNDHSPVAKKNEVRR